MTEIETTINEAIEGGWKNLQMVDGKFRIMFFEGDAYAEPDFIQVHYEVVGVEPPCNKNYIGFTKNEALLDPKFWQAVGKTRGWEEPLDITTLLNKGYKEYMIHFMSLIADGLTIEAALTKLR